VTDLELEHLVLPAPPLEVPPMKRRTRRPVRIRPRRPEPTRQNLYPDVAAFVEGFWAPTFARAVGPKIETVRWCPQWWAHAEAIVRLEAAWRAWEVLRLDPGTGPSAWLRDHADPCQAALTAPDGPFRRCSTQHQAAAPLPCATPPTGLF
jgi:hypothetical protein